jgi:hypothetical protein
MEFAPAFGIDGYRSGTPAQMIDKALPAISLPDLHCLESIVSIT